MKNILRAKFLQKFFLLMVMSLGIIFIYSEKHPVGATDCFAQYQQCTATAYDNRENCYSLCAGIIACENVCNQKYDSAITDCDIEYENCINN